MKSTKLQLLVTLVAVLAATGFFASRGLPPTQDISVAAYYGDIRQVRRALDWGVAVNRKNSQGATPLYVALTVGNMDVAELLVDRGADVNANDFDGLPFGLCAAKGSWERTMRLFETRRVPVNLQNMWRCTLLHLAVFQRDKEMVKFLLAHGAATNVKEIHGDTPLHWAVQGGSDDIADLLRQHGAKE